MRASRQNLIGSYLADPPVLEGGLELDLEPVDDRSALMIVQGGGHRFRARADVLTVPYPSGLKRLVASRPEVEVVLVDHASRGLDDAARELRVGYLDRAGRGRLVGPGFVYVVPPGDSANARRRDAAGPAASPSGVTPFAPKASRAVRALLADPHREWRLAEIARACRMNPGTAHRILGALVDAGFVERNGKSYVVEDPGSLLDAWAGQAARARPSERVALPVGGDARGVTEKVLEALGGAGVVSGELAAELYAPHLPAAHALVHCIDGEAWDRRRVADVVPDRPLRVSGQVVVDVMDAGVADFSQVRDGLPLVSPPQLYVDMHRERGRAREAAEHVREQVLGF